MANASNTADDLLKQINDIRADIAKLTKLVGDVGEASTAGLRSQAKERIDRLSEFTEEELAALRERAGVAGQKFTETVREQPLAAVGIAVGLGFLAALLMRK